jgi:hypothetical protein
MASPNGPRNPGKIEQKAAREQRLAEALRANLRKRRAADAGKKPAGVAAEPKKP